MLRNMGCHNITPRSKQNSEYEFWTKSPNPDTEQNVLNQLYELGFIIAQPIDSSNIFWSCFNKSLMVNKNGENRKQRILSIVANDFKYKDLQENL
ncbi:Ubiquitin carboxyl-terminal hydrolase 14, partial [Gigaspora margarita]